MAPVYALCLILLAGTLGGCGIFSPEESKEVGPVPIEPYPAALDPDQLITNFVDSHVERNFQEYDRLLHEFFEFRFAIEDIDASETELGVWDRARDVSSAEAMFGGREGKIDPDTGQPQSPAVQSISLVLSPVGQWRTDIDPAIEADRWREYDVEMDVHYQGGDIAEVQGRQRFYVKQVESGGTQVWKLKRWEDNGNPNVTKGSPTL